MSKIVFVTGGARSGKSTFAEKLVQEMTGTIGYMATAIVTDEDMADRIAHHQASRPSSWPTFEGYRDFELLLDDAEFMACDNLILDCITILVTNIMFDLEMDYETVSMDRVNEIEGIIAVEIAKLLEIIRTTKKNLVVVSNEVGLGLVPPYRLGNLFRDIGGRMNQRIAKEADEAYFVVSGLPMRLK